MSKRKTRKSPLTTATVLAMFAQVNKQIEQMVIENRERSAEIDKKFAEVEKLFKEVGKRIDNTNSSIGGISNSNGDFAEAAIYGALDRDMSFGGIKFDDIQRNIEKHSKKINLRCEFDVVLKNGDTLAIIETKYKVKKDDVDDLVLKKLNNFRQLFPEYNSYKIILGIGGMSFEDGVIQEANTNGIGIIKVIGEKVEFQITDIKIY